MKSHHDFSKGERGKFYHPDAVLTIPVYLDPDVEEAVRVLAEQAGKDVGMLVNDWLRNSIHIVQSAQPSPSV